MATYQRFEDLPVWKTAAELYDRCDDFLDHAPKRLRYAVRDQLERAVISVSNNIAEGFERGTTNELLNFIYIARGSAGEVRSMLTILRRRPWMSNFESELSELIRIAQSCSQQLRGWADSLQNSDIKGTRHLNKESHDKWKQKKARQEGQQRLDEQQRAIAAKLPANHPVRIQWEQKHGPLE